MNDTEIAWLAGLLEGEGSFLLASPSDYKAHVAITLQMTDEDVVARVAAMVGLKYQSCPPAKAHWKTTYKLRIKGRKAIVIMEAVLQYMGERRSKKIREVLASVERRPRFTWAPKLTPEVRRKITTANAAGKSARAIGRQLGIHHSCICKFLNGGYG